MSSAPERRVARRQASWADIAKRLHAHGYEGAECGEIEAEIGFSPGDLEISKILKRFRGHVTQEEDTGFASAEEIAVLLGYIERLEHQQSQSRPWVRREDYRGVPGTRVLLWWWREGVPVQYDDAIIGRDGSIATKGDGWAYRYSHVQVIERPPAGPVE